MAGRRRLRMASGHDRKFLRIGFQKLSDAGYTLAGGDWLDPDGRPLTLRSDADGATRTSRLALAFQQTLRKIGIDRVDPLASTPRRYQQRMQRFDFDLIFFRYTASLSPGIEQASRWGSEVRDQTGTFNSRRRRRAPPSMRCSTLLINARTRPEFVDVVRALDRTC